MSEENKAPETQEATVSEDQMEKALADLQNAARGPEDEKQELLSKALAGDISDEENGRLASLLSGEAVSEKPAEEDLAKSVTAELQPEQNEAINKSIEVSAFLKAQNEGVVSGLEKIAARLEKSDTADNEYRMLLSKAIVELGKAVRELDNKQDARDEVIKSLKEEVAKYGETVPSGPKAIVGDGSMEKSFAGVSPVEGLSKSEVVTRLSAMSVEALEKGEQALGDKLFLASTIAESGAPIDPALMREVEAYKR